VATVDTALALERTGVDVTLFADGTARLPDRAARLSRPVVRLEPLPALMRRPLVADGLFLPTKLAVARRWRRSVDASLDVAHSFSPGFAALLPRSLPVTVQAWFHPPRIRQRLATMLAFAPRGPHYPAHVLLELQSHASDLLGYRRASLVVANTETAKNALRAAGYRAECVPPCVVVLPEPPARERSAAFRITFCAHPLARPRKGLVHLLAALEQVRHRPLQLTLVGGGADEVRSGLDSLRRQGIDVVETGRIARDAYLEELALRTDLLAFPSLYEEWGYALLEALSQGVPVLAFDLYPFFEIVDGDTGVLVPAGDPGAMAAAIDAAAGGRLPDPAAVLRSTRERFGAESVAQRLLGVLEMATGAGTRT